MCPVLTTCPVLSRCRPLAATLTLSALLLPASMLSAQSQDDQGAMSLSLEALTHAQVFSASRHLEDSRQAPASVSIITAADIRRYGWRTLGEAINSLRGFYTSYDRQYTYLGVRGLLRPGDYNSRVLLLINGHRTNENVYDSAFIGTEFELDLDLIDHIEIVRGPSSSLFGTNAVFGVINVITRRLSGNAVETSADTSSFLGRTGRITTTFEQGKLSGLFSGSLFRSNGQSALFYPEFASPATNNGWADNIDGDRYGHAFADLQYGHFRLHGLFSSRTKSIPTASYGRSFDDPANTSTDSRAYAELTYHRAVSLGDLEVRVYDDWYEFFGLGAFNEGPAAPRILASNWASAIWLGTAASLDRQIGRQRMLVGGDFEHSVTIRQTNQILGQPSLFVDHRSPSRAAAYGEGELNLIPKLSIRIGARMDWFSAYGGSFSPRIALVYSPEARTALKYIYGEAFRAPNAYESYYYDGITSEPPPSPLIPERMRSNEVIVERGLSSWFQLSVDASNNRLKNLIDQVPDASTGFTEFVNIGRDRGLTLEMELEAKRASGLAARASYTLADATDDIQHSWLANSPKRMAKLNTTLPLFHHSFAGIELLSSSAQKTYQDTTVDSALLANATFSSGPLFRDWQFSASGYNALNHRWFSPAGPAFAQAQIQQDGRTFLFKLSHTLAFERSSK